MNAAAKECGVCREEFDEKLRCPRIFQCSHTLCTSCIDRLITDKTKKCPFCKRTFKANLSKDIVVNTLAIELIKCLSLQEKNSKPSTQGKVCRMKERLEDIMKETRQISYLHLFECQVAQMQIENTLEELTDLQKNIKQKNNRIENDVQPKIQNLISQNNKRVEELNRTKEQLQSQLKNIEGKGKQLTNLERNLDSCTDNTFRETAALLDDAEETNHAIDCWIKNFNGVISEEEKRLRIIEAMKRIDEKINIIFKVLSSEKEIDEEDFDTIPVMGAMAIQEDNLPSQINCDDLREMNAQVTKLVSQGRVYALQHHKGMRRSARISFTEDDKLCLHHLTDQPLPPNVYVVDHEDIMRLVDPSSRLNFLELGADELTLGRLYIRLYGDTMRAENFSLLCTGEKGPSYAHTNILKVFYKNENYERVCGGDYKTNDGNGGLAVVSLHQEGREETIRPWLMRSVSGGFRYETDGQFNIYTRDCPGKMRNNIFGIVEEGFSVLTEAISHYPNIREVYTKDCGIVLNS